MRKLSQDTEARLLSAIERTVQLVHAGSSPDEAIVKVAQDDGIPPGQIRLLVNTYNTGRTTRQRQDGADVFEKAATFPLADASIILEALYPSNVKTAAQVEHDTAVSATYAAPPPRGLTQRMARAEATKLACVEPARLCDPPPPLPREPLTRMKAAYYDAEREQRLIEEARRKESAALDTMTGTFFKLSNYFRDTTAIPFVEVRENAQLLHGAPAVRLLDTVVEHSPAIMKLAHNSRVSATPRPAVGEPYALLLQFADDVDRYNAARADHEKIARAGRERQESLLAPFAEYRGPGSVLAAPPSSHKLAGFGQLVDTAAKGSLAAGLWDRISGGLKGPDNSSMVNAQVEALTDPDHEARLNQIQAGALLNELGLNDPVISGYRPDEIASSFNDIVSVSPRAATQKLLLQPLMRMRLEQGGVDPHTADLALGAEGKMRDRDMAGNAALNPARPKTGESRRASIFDN